MVKEVNERWWKKLTPKLGYLGEGYLKVNVKVMNVTDRGRLLNTIFHVNMKTLKWYMC